MHYCMHFTMYIYHYASIRQQQIPLFKVKWKSSRYDLWHVWLYLGGGWYCGGCAVGVEWCCCFASKFTTSVYATMTVIAIAPLLLGIQFLVYLHMQSRDSIAETYFVVHPCSRVSRDSTDGQTSPYDAQRLTVLLYQTASWLLMDGSKLSALRVLNTVLVTLFDGHIMVLKCNIFHVQEKYLEAFTKGAHTLQWLQTIETQK